MRVKRKCLSYFKQKQSSKNLAKNIEILLKKAKKNWTAHLKIGVYLAGDGEINIENSLNHLTKKKHSCAKITFYYPIIQPDKSLKFATKTRDKLPKRNQYKIPEPLRRHQKKIISLDLLFLPLVAATPQCERLGMGGGFYDRTLAVLKPWKHKPLLIGVAHQLQIQSAIPIAPWDFPLDFIATDLRVYTRSV